MNNADYLTTQKENIKRKYIPVKSPTPVKIAYSEDLSDLFSTFVDTNAIPTHPNPAKNTAGVAMMVFNDRFENFSIYDLNK